MKLGNVLLPDMVGMVGHRLGDLDCLAPFLFLLVNLQQRTQCFLVACRAAQFDKNVLGTIEQTGFQIVMAKFGQCVQSLVVTVVLSILSTVTCGFGAVLFLVVFYWAYQAYQGQDVRIPFISDFIRNQGWA